nr:lactate dehydrogenase/glycoside hydrolase, family 4, C-terminal [Tanacetum cinerariifolium]GFA67222.1 lactate dehydrogenase/glycoside hydrolase, family 4, C-terminal [Tanacetum cinerariifolium]
MAIAQTILTQDLADETALMDVNADKLHGKMLDLQHAAAFLLRSTISASVDYSSTVGSDVMIVTAGARQIPGESRLWCKGTWLCFPRLPANRVIGFGTNLDSSRFCFLIVDHLDVNAQDVQ